MYENKILNHRDQLFPDYYCVRFKKSVESIFGTGIPDLVLIDKQYREWIVVEVELEHHSLYGDVLDQIMKFAHGDYTKEHARYLKEKNQFLDFEKLLQLITGTQPKIFVFVPVEKPEWSRQLLPFNTKISVIEVWEDDTGRSLLRIDGDQPTAKSSNFLSNLFRERLIPKALKVENPAILPKGDRIKVIFQGLSSEWAIMRSKSSAWLIPTGRNPLDEVSALSFKLISNNEMDFALEENYGSTA